jgi:hypothetical protein
LITARPTILAAAMFNKSKRFKPLERAVDGYSAATDAFRESELRRVNA